MRLSVRLPVALLLSAGLAAPAFASSAASSAAQTASSTVGSLSDSLQGSSQSSSGADRVAAGEYRIVEIAEAGRPGHRRLQLQHVERPGEAGALALTLPQAVVEQARLAAGQHVAARPRPYGYEFARADNREAFFLVLEDAWYRDLGAHVVTL